MNKKFNWLEAKLEKLQSIKEYVPKYYPEVLAKQLGIDIGKLIRFDKNENLFIPKAFLSEILKELTEEIDPRFYPQREKTALTEKLVDYLNVPVECIILGNGSDELIETIVRTFLEANEEAISIIPTFAMYRIIVKNNGNAFKETYLREDFSLNVEDLLSKTSSKTILCFLCSPNNPTGNQFSIESVREIIEKFSGLVVVDEAYVEYAPYSVKDMIKKYENLIVLRTFSKAFGLAGLRIGYGLASSNVVSALKKIQLPFNINKVSLQLAHTLINKRKIVDSAVKKLKVERERFIRKLNKISGVKAFPSDANFILFKTVKETDTVVSELTNQGILIRDIGNILNMGRCLRVTIGPPEMNNKFLNALTAICGG
jgi:histidinol-phosphate aminotransferase